MKNLIIMTILIGSTGAMACKIQLVKTSAKAKSAKIGNVSVSAKIQEALKTQCTVETRLLTEAEKRTLKIAKLKSQLTKLQAVK